MKYMVRFLMVLLLCGTSLYAYSFDGKSDKILTKNGDIVKESAPDDWYTLASCAEHCIKKNIVNKEVAEWIDRSLEIKKSSYNLEVKGDYYMKNKLPEKAGEFYLEAIKIGLEEDRNFNYSGLQSKIARIMKMET